MRAWSDERFEQEYNPRHAVPDFERHFQRAVALSEKTRAARVAAGRAALDVRYGAGQLATLDVFPAEPKNAPIHVFLHGGYWRGRDKSDYSYIADALVPQGITTIVMNYDLCPQVELPMIVAQIKEGFAWIQAHAPALGGAADKITASGHSAGAHLIAAALAADQADTQALCPVRAALLISGIYELEPVLRISVNEQIRLRAEQVDAMSPLRHPPSAAVPLVVAVGGAETDSWIAESRRFAQLCASHGTACLYAELPQENHFSVMRHFETPGDWLTRMAASMAFA